MLAKVPAGPDSGQESSLQMLDAAHGKTENPPLVIDGVDSACVEIQSSTRDRAGVEGGRRPVVPVRADTRQGCLAVTVAVARSRRSVQSLD